MKATIHEFGNGFPEVGALVPGRDGNLYEVYSIGRGIETGNHLGQSNYISGCVVNLADWECIDDPSDVFPAWVTLDDDDDSEADPSPKFDGF